MPAPVVKTITVPAKPETAFAIFTRDLGKWWPLATNSISAMTGGVARAVTMGQGVGAPLVETSADGEELIWGKVTVWEPGKRLGLDWHVGGPADRATKVLVEFQPTEAGTRVTLTHDGWEILGDKAQSSRDSYNSGWVNVFETAYAGACAA